MAIRMSMRMVLGAPLLCMFASLAHGQIIGPQDVNCGGVKVGELRARSNFVNPFDNVTANFTAGAGGVNFNINTAATQCKSGHFNWMNIVRNGTAGVTPDDPSQAGNQAVAYPWVDPLSGGNRALSTDPQSDDVNLPGYWTEAAPTPGELATHINGNVLDYSDQPQNAANVTANFETYLLGIPGDIGQTSHPTIAIFGAFTWTFTMSANGNTSTINNVAFLPIAAAAVASVNAVLSAARNFPNWTAVPEPGSLSLLLVGALALLRRRRS